MSEIYLKRVHKLSRKKAERFVFDLANYGDSSNSTIRFQSIHELKKYCSLARISFDSIVEQTRDISKNVPHFENLVGSLWTAKGVTVSKINPETGEYETILAGDGQWSEAPYWTFFENSYKIFESSIENSSYSDFFIAVERGLSSIEHYIYHRARIWNGQNPTRKLIDNANTKVRFEKKLDDWIPMMSDGISIDKGTEVWRSFKKMKELRDKSIVHTSSPVYGLQYKELAQLMKNYGLGIAGFLFHLHIVFSERTPSIIIRAYHTSDVIVIC